LTDAPAPARRALPIWLMGLGFLPLGAAGSITLITVPQLLSGAHVPEQQIATVTSIALMPGFITFALAPLLDWRFRRRTYAILFMLVSAACQFGALLSIGNLALLTVLLFATGVSIGLCVAAVGAGSAT